MTGGPISWGCRIQRLHLCRGGVLPLCRDAVKFPGYDVKQSNGEAPVILNFGECGILLHFHHSHVQSGLEW